MEREEKPDPRTHAGAENLRCVYCEDEWLREYRQVLGRWGWWHSQDG